MVKKGNIKNVMEIGFNIGHSAETFLSTNKDINLVSFDIGEHDYYKLGKQFIDDIYPGRHELILGNSLMTVQEYSIDHDIKFDLIFVDGGHDYSVARGDLLNCKKLSHDHTIVIMDDTIQNEDWINWWNIGPNKAWKECVEKNIVKEIGSIDFSPTHGVSWGVYV